MSVIRSGLSRQVLRAILLALPQTLNLAATRFPAFRARLKQRDVVGWIGLQDGSIGRIVEIRNGRVRSRQGAASEAQVTMTFKDAATALKLLLPNREQGEIIHAAKSFKVVTAGPDDLVVWFTQTLNMSETAGLEMGTPMPDGSRTSNTRHLVFDLWDQIAHLSQAMTLEPGDLIFTGTPGGIGFGSKPYRPLKAGDVVRSEIDGVGAIENRVVAEA